MTLRIEEKEGDELEKLTHRWYECNMCGKDAPSEIGKNGHFQSYVCTYPDNWYILGKEEQATGVHLCRSCGQRIDSFIKAVRSSHEP